MHQKQFDFVLQNLTIEEIWVLQVVSDLRGLFIAKIYPVLSETEIRSALKTLEGCGLIRRDPYRAWVCTWAGTGVNNWRSQMQLAEPGLPIPGPREGENVEVLGPPCSHYRQAFFSPEFCWCRRHRYEHACEVVEAACRLLSRRQRSQ